MVAWLQPQRWGAGVGVWASPECFAAAKEGSGETSPGHTCAAAVPERERGCCAAFWTSLFVYFSPREMLQPCGHRCRRAEAVQELSPWLFLGAGCQTGVGTGRFLLEVYK